MVIKWRTDSVTDSVVRYGSDPGSLTLSESVATSTTEHEVTLTTLSADTKYFYSIGTSTQTLAGGDNSHFFFTSPLAGTTKPTRIWVLGDSGTANANAQAVRDAYSSFTGTIHTDLWLMLGDNAYSDGTAGQYQAAVFDMYPQMLRKSVLWPTLGNHDGHSADSASQTGPYYDIFTLPTGAEAGGVASGTEAYYSFDYGNVHFICLDSYETNRSTSGAMANWLLADLQTNDQEWIVAFWHHPPYTKGSHDSDTESRLVEMRENFLPTLEQYGVDLVLSGHSHSYERSFLIDGHYDVSSTFLASMKKDGGSGQEDGDGAYQKTAVVASAHEGAVYVVAGISGRPSGGSINHPAMFFSLILRLGSLVLDFNDNRLDVRFLDSTGVVQDYFTILKSLDTTTINVTADRAALVALYNATGGADWTINTNWLTNEALSEWHRVETDADGRVTALRLVANGLSGEIPASLGDLANLQELYLNDNELTGTIPPALENLAQLRVFHIHNTGLCVPPGSGLQTWLATIDFQGSVCSGGGGGGGGPRTSAPGAPRNLTAVGGNGEVVLSWDAPASDGGAAITDYEYRINGRNPWISTGSTATTHTVTGLVNGAAYTFEVRAVNRIGTGRVPNQTEATPVAPEVFTLDFAHFANGNGTTSDLVFVNVAPQPVRPALYFYDTEGNPITAESVVDITGDLEISEDGGLTVLTEMEPLGELTISSHGQGGAGERIGAGGRVRSHRRVPAL